jgi:hypothetical protein
VRGETQLLRTGTTISHVKRAKQRVDAADQRNNRLATVRHWQRGKESRAIGARENDERRRRNVAAKREAAPEARLGDGGGETIHERVDLILA